MSYIEQTYGLIRSIAPIEPIVYIRRSCGVLLSINEFMIMTFLSQLFAPNVVSINFLPVGKIAIAANCRPNYDLTVELECLSQSGHYFFFYIIIQQSDP